MKEKSMLDRKSLLTLVSIGLGLGLLITGLAWPWWSLSLVGASLLLTGAWLNVQQRFPSAGPRQGIPKPVLLLAVVAAMALVYLFPELFVPGCGGMPRAFAGCPAACRVTTCTDWDAPGENGCDARPPHKGCCVSYETSCVEGCGDEDPDDPPPPVYRPPTVSGTIGCAVPGAEGWCLSGAALNLSASDPQGYALTISGDLAGAAFSCAGPACSQALPIGSGTTHFQASAPASGLSSALGSAPFAFDPTPPTATLVISGTNGASGWYTAASVSVTGADATSGISVTQVSVDGGPWQSSATLLEGTHSVVGRALDHAGNLILTPAQVVKVDATAPTISASVSPGTRLTDWYLSKVSVSASVLDVTSGIGLTEYRLNGGSWEPGDQLTILADGLHTVDFRTTDRAGNASSASLSIMLDATPPKSAFSQPLEGTTLKVTGTVLLSGISIDALSGLAATEISLDDGETWQALPQTDGVWSYAWDTLRVRDGLYTLLVRADDQAGNRENTARVRIIVGNRPPKVEIQDSWWLWEAGDLKVQQRQISIRDVTLRISCAPYHPDVVLVYTGENFPASVTWDRRCGNGAYAAESGDYPVTLMACDTFGHCAEDSGFIKVPLIAPPAPTKTPTVEPAVAATATPEATRSVQKPHPTPTRLVPPPVVTPVPVPAAPFPQPAWLAWSLGILLAGLLALATAAVLDPRPRALRRLGKTLEGLARDGQA
jgi:hypothetical protein